ncbi:MAG TPA: diacylglycerol kinase [Stellaceae bacterium]|nr:diacylglycerol kinase [Stellaceae bacterium]
MKNHTFLPRLGFATVGLGDCWRRERSFRTQLALGALAVVVTAAIGAQLIWCAAVALASAIVLAAELFNAALEALADRLHPEIHPEIRIAKDMAAGGVLVASLGALAVGMLMLWSTL